MDATPSDALSSYMIAIDGITSMYSNATPGINLKSTPSGEPTHIESHSSSAVSQDDPVVHVITSSPVAAPPPHKGPSIAPPESPGASIVKLVPPHERVTVTMEGNLT